MRSQLDTERYYVASSWSLMWRKFVRHRVALVAGILLAGLYITASFAGFIAPYHKTDSRGKFALAPPMRVRIIDSGRLQRPFVYGLDRSRDPVTLMFVYEEDPEAIYPIRFFVRGDEYDFIGLFRTDLHLFGVDEPGTVFLFGTDQLGRDVFSRIMYGARISLSVGFLGVVLSFIFGCLLGGVSGLFGGGIDTAIQRVIEFLISLPTIPLWMALAAAIPIDWPPIRTYFMITVILSILGWTELARVVRGKVLELREEDYVMAASVSGSTAVRIITRHLLPNFIGYLIVHFTLAVPRMILAETALSFLNVGLRPPVVSWGVALQQASNVRTVAQHWWLLIPALFVVAAVLCFNSPRRRPSRRRRSLPVGRAGARPPPAAGGCALTRRPAGTSMQCMATTYAAPTLTPADAVSAERLRQLQEHGFCIVPDMAPPPLIEHTRACVERAVATQDEERLARTRSPGTLIDSDGYPELADLIGNPAALDELHRMGFTDIKFWKAVIISKPPGGPRLYWHQDCMLWQDPRSYSEVPGMIFLMYYLEDTSRRNGCLRLIPGSHRRRLESA